MRIGRGEERQHGGLSNVLRSAFAYTSLFMISVLTWIVRDSMTSDPAWSTLNRSKSDFDISNF